MIVVADPDRAFRARLASLLGPPDGVLEVDRISDLERTLTSTAGGVSVVVIGPDVGSSEALHFAETARRISPHVSVVVVARKVDSSLLHAALRAGVRDVLPTSFAENQLRETVEEGRVLSRQLRGREHVPGVKDEVEHKIITVVSPKGGSGKSFISSNLAVLLAERTGVDVGLADLDLQFGDLAIMLQLFPAHTIHEAAQDVDRLDSDALRGYLTSYRSKVHLLAAPLEPALAEMITAESVRRLLVMLRELFPYVVVDTSPSFSDHLLRALDETSELVLMTTMDVPSIKNFKLALQTLELLGFNRDRIRLVLNRADSKVGLSVEDVEKSLGAKVDILIPSSRQVPLSINHGSPLVLEDPQSPVTAAIGALADRLGIAAVRRARAGVTRLWRR
jgi:pilus assembly protein CpaE